MLGDRDIGRRETFAQHLDSLVRLGIAAHEDVELCDSASTATPEIPSFGVKWCRWICSSVAPAASTQRFSTAST